MKTVYKIPLLDPENTEGFQHVDLDDHSGCRFAPIHSAAACKKV
jgi:hypothetical protein